MRECIFNFARGFWLNLRSARLRAALSLGIVLGFGSISTMAYWTDSATVTGGQFAAGTMDLQIDSGAVGQGSNYAKTSMTWSGLAPSERKAFNFQVKNVGNPPFTYGATVARGASPAWTYVDPSITVQAFQGTAVADTTYPQQDSCTGGALGGVVPAVGIAAASLIPTPQEIAGGAAQNICIVVGLADNAANTNQGKTGSLSMVFKADQKQ